MFIEKKFKNILKFCKTILYYTCKLIETTENTDMAEMVKAYEPQALVHLSSILN